MRREYGTVYRELYARHWWWRAREYIISNLLGQITLPGTPRILDFGCGDALAFPLLQRYGDVYGIEPDHRLISPENPYASRIQHYSIPHPSYSGQIFDLITAFDVIEHIDDDRTIVSELYQMLAPGGTLILTVPASMALWDAHDVVNEHKRRYSPKAIRALVPSSGELVRLGYLFHSLYPVKRVFALFNRGRSEPVEQHAIPPYIFNELAKMFCVIEYRICRRLAIPWGTSLYTIIQKPPRTSEEQAF